MEIITSLLWILALLATVLVGYILLWSMHALPPSRLELFATSFLIGSGAVSLELFFTNILGIPWNLLWLIAPWIAVALAHLSHHPSEPVFPHLELPSISMLWKIIQPLDVLLFFVLMTLVGVLGFVSVQWPMNTVDSFAIWAFKARAFFLDDGLTGTFFRYDHTLYSHWDYPLHIPLFWDWIAQWMGTFSLPLLKATNTVLFTSGIGIFWSNLRHAIGRRSALLWSIVLISIPILFKTAGMSLEADLPLAIFFLGSGINLFRAFRANPSRAWILCGLFTGLAAWTKNEGMIWLVMISIILLIHGLRHRNNFPNALRAIALAVLLALPWRLFQWSRGFASDLFASPVIFHFDRAQMIIKAILRQFLLWESWGILWILVAASMLILLIQKIRHAPRIHPAVALLGIALLLQALAYGLVYIITPLPIEWHLGSSLNRILLHLAPLLLFLSALVLSPSADDAPLPLESTDWRRWRRFVPWILGAATISLAFFSTPQQPLSFLIAGTFLIAALLALIPSLQHSWKTLPKMWWIAAGITTAITFLHPFYPETLLPGITLLLGLCVFAGCALSSHTLLSPTSLPATFSILGSGISLATIVKFAEGSQYHPDLSILFLALPLAFSDLQTSRSWRRFGQLSAVFLMVTAIARSFFNIPLWGDEWQWTLTIIRNHPWLGIGAGQLPLFLPEQADHWINLSLAPHSAVLQGLSEWGTIEFTIIIGFVATALWKTRNIHSALTRSLFIFLVASTFLVNWLAPLPWILLCLTLGILWTKKSAAARVAPARPSPSSPWPWLWSATLIAVWIGFSRFTASEIFLQTAKQLQQSYQGSLLAAPYHDK
ncbi:MAG: hypothetical protein AAB733_01850, partial [Patescibacteria group bacterium]